MTMNTLAIAKKLKESGFTPQQAEAQAELWSDIVESDLATKIDIKGLEVALKRDIKDVDLKISQVEANLKRDLKEMDGNIQRDLKAIDEKMKFQQATLEKGHAETQARLMQIGIGLVVLIIAAVTFLLRLFSHA